MVNRGINAYVREQLDRGYTPEMIRSALIRAGYNPQDINFALHVATKQPRRIAITGRNLALAVGIALTAVLLILTGFFLFTPGPKEIQIAVQVDKPQLFPGDTLEIRTTLNSEQKRSVPVALDYLVTNIATRRTVTSRSERLNVGESSFTTKSVPLPKTLDPGEYEVRLIAKFEGVTRVKTTKFTVQQPIVEVPEIIEELLPEEVLELEPVELECPATCDDLNPATEDYCERGTCMHRLLEGVCGNGQCEDGENRITCPADCGDIGEKEAVLAQAAQQALLDPEKASTLCNSLVLPEDSDQCFGKIANISQRSALCTNIQDMRKEDNCYMEFAFAGDYSVCPLISNKFFLTSCYSLSRLQASQAMAEQVPPEVTGEGA